MNIMEAAEHHYDRLWDEQCDNEALLEYLCLAAVFILCGSADWIASAVAGVVA